MSVEIVQGREVTIRFDATRCIHSRNFVRSHPEVFVPNVKGEWIFPDAASAEVVIGIGRMCPSGAIRVLRQDGSAGSDTPPGVNTLRVRENGPLAVEATLTLRGEPLPSPRATLCRCGASQRKPFCDGSHVAAGFAATGEPVAKDGAPLEARNGPVNIAPQPNGPLKLVGNLEVVSGTGRTVNKVRQAFFCRCGNSKNKPWCDSSHKLAGFIAD